MREEFCKKEIRKDETLGVIIFANLYALYFDVCNTRALNMMVEIERPGI